MAQDLLGLYNTDDLKEGARRRLPKGPVRVHGQG